MSWRAYIPDNVGFFHVLLITLHDVITVTSDEEIMRNNGLIIGNLS